MDAFFAAIEERNNPRWRGLPIVVGADPLDGRGRGVVSTANYKARVFGIKSAMPISQAWQLARAAEANGSPSTIFVSGGFSTYGRVSRTIMEIVSRHVSVMQQRSIDEAYFDLSFTSSFSAAAILCQKIKMDIFSTERLTASIGLGPNKLMAKIASDHSKPDGLIVVESEQVFDFLTPLPIRVIPGIGPKTANKLHNLGVKTVEDLRSLSQPKLSSIFGKWGISLYSKARGHDDAPLSEAALAKSISKNRTFNQDTKHAREIMQECLALCSQVMNQLRSNGFRKFGRLTLTVRFHDFETLTRTHSLKKPINSVQKLKQEALKLLLQFLDSRENPKQKKIRLIGVRLEKFI